MAPRLVVEVVGDTSQLERSFKRASKATGNLQRDLGRAGRGSITAAVGFRGLGRTVAFASGAFLGGAGLTAAVKAGFSELADGQKVTAQTAAALKSTGRVAGVTAKEISNLASTIQKYSGFDDEAVQASENLLLTFTQIRNEAGRGNDVFTQTTRLVADMSRAFDQDLSSSAIQLGKALNDPSQGLSALRRIGISFTDSQVATIKRLQETGRALEAQKIILAEVRREVGGSAEAYGKTLGGQLDILKGNLENTAGSFAQVLAPSIQKALDKVNAWLSDARNQKKLNDAFTSSVDRLAAAFTGLASAIEHATSAYGKFRDIGAKFPGGKEGFLSKLLTGTLPEQLEDAANRMQKLADAFGGVAAQASDARVAVGAFVHDIGQGGFGSTRSPLLPRQNVIPPGMQADPFADARPVPGVRERFASDQAAARDRKARLLALRNTVFDAKVARAITRAQYLPTLRDQIKALQEVAGLIRARIAVTKDTTRRLTLEDQLLSVQYTITQDQAEIAGKIADAAKEKARKDREAAKAAAEAARARVAALDAARKALGEATRKAFQAEKQQQRVGFQASVFGLLGLGPTGDTRTPTQGNLQAALKRGQAALAGTPLDTRAMRSRLSSLRNVINSEFGRLTRDTKIAVKDFLDALSGKDSGGLATGRQAASIGQLTAGTGLRGAGLRRLEFNLAGAHLTTPVRGARTTVVHTSVNLDGRQVARNTTEHQERDQRRRAYQTRGRQSRK